MIGEPKPIVSWQRAKGDMSDPEKFQNKFDPITNEHTLEVRILSTLDNKLFRKIVYGLLKKLLKKTVCILFPHRSLKLVVKKLTHINVLLQMSMEGQSALLS